MSEASFDHGISDIEHWWHSIRLADDVVTPGFKSPEILADELERLRLPDLTAKRVLDVGAWDGFFSFECERRGAAEVVALDHYVWSMDLVGYERHRRDCVARNRAPLPPHETPAYWQPDSLPGKAGFDAAREALSSQVEPVVGDFMEMPLDEIGEFDVVLYLGVIYHIENPLQALRRLASVTRGVAIIETEAVFFPTCPDESLARFHPFSELNDDVTNWWVPTYRALADMCLAAGFDEVEATTELPRRRVWPRWLTPASRREPVHYRLVVHAHKDARDASAPA